MEVVIQNTLKAKKVSSQRSSSESFCFSHISGGLNRSKVLVFETCQRQVELFLVPYSESFVLRQQIEGLNDDSVQFYIGVEAYKFLVELLCGMHSIVSWETEVLGQFKEFVYHNKQDIQQMGFAEFFQNVLNETKCIRDKFLQNVGQTSYGSITRKLLASYEGVLLIGRGQLAQSIAPWIEKKKSRYLLVRSYKCHGNESLEKFEPVNFPDVFELAEKIQSVVIAAPIDDHALYELLNVLPLLKCVIDWRGDGQIQACDQYHVHHLFDLENQIQCRKEKDQALRTEISQYVQAKAYSFLNRVKHNPWGWEDFSC